MVVIEGYYSVKSGISLPWHQSIPNSMFLKLPKVNNVQQQHKAKHKREKDTYGI